MTKARQTAEVRFRTGVIMDPIAGIKTYKDSTFAMLLEAQRRQHEIWYMEPGHLTVRDGVAYGHMRRLQVRDDTVDWLRAQGYTVPETDANFALFGPVKDREAVFKGLLARGVLIRVTGPEGYMRVSIGTAREMAMFRNALLEVTA